MATGCKGISAPLHSTPLPWLLDARASAPHFTALHCKGCKGISTPFQQADAAARRLCRAAALLGGGTLGHPWGNAPGAVANRVALEACTQAQLRPGVPPGNVNVLVHTPGSSFWAAYSRFCTIALQGVQYEMRSCATVWYKCLC